MLQGTLKGTGEATTNDNEVLLARLSQLTARYLYFLNIHKGGGEGSFFFFFFFLWVNVSWYDDTCDSKAPGR